MNYEKPLELRGLQLKLMAFGSVVFSRDHDETIYYQVFDAATKEELFTQNPRGTRVVIAGQLGTLDATGAFRKYGWVPPMNAPVFLAKKCTISPEQAPKCVDDFTLGSIAQTGMTIRASLAEMAGHHTAVLGVTGTGKTELVLDMIRAHAKAGRKIFCVDCTGEYEPRLKDMSPDLLGFDAPALAALDDLVNATEHGEYSAGNEKKALHNWVKTRQADVDGKVEQFLASSTSRVGIFSLPDIANTRATLRATAMYISAIFSWAKKNRRAREIVIVLEEAHTIVPEWNLFRYDKADTDAVVGRMAQIALQGRKYGEV